MTSSRLSKNQVDKVGDRLRNGEIDLDVVTKLEAYRREFDDAYQFVEEVLKDLMGLSVTGRPSKSTIAIAEKLRRETVRLSQIQDIAGCRVVVGGIVEQDAICAKAQYLLGRVEVDDRRRKPSNGYRAVHLIAERKGYVVEVQVRTRIQHAWAEISEKFADSFGQEIKYGSGDAEALSFLAQLSELSDKLETIDYQKWELSRGSRIARAAMSLPGRHARIAMKKLSRDRVECVRKIRTLFAVYGAMK